MVQVVNADGNRPPSSASSPPDYVSEVHGGEGSSITELPGYEEVRAMMNLRPLQPVTYTFSEWTSNSMLLLPPSTDGSLSPLYFISVELNLHPFIPLSYVTTVRRGNTQGRFVGNFELAIHHKREIVTLGHTTTKLSTVLRRINGSTHHWRWQFEDVTLRWDCRSFLDDGSPMWICYETTQARAQLATFVPPPLDASPPLPAAQLTVFPDGHEFFDHILLSALVVERKRTLDS